MDIKIIGAGLGGLAASCLLARKGHNVTIFEKNDRPGGKINEMRTNGFRFDTGPSLLTMPLVFEKLFENCGRQLGDYLDIRPLDPMCRYFYPNGSEFDCHRDRALNIAQLQEFAPEDVQAYKQFQQYSKELYQNTKDSFLLNPMYGISDLSDLKFTDFFKIDAFKSVAGRIDQMFESPEMRKFFKQFTTYNGSSPFKAPATLNVIPYAEMAFGGYYIDGGMYSLIDALIRLATELGVEIRYEAEINRICIADGKVSGVTDADGNHHSSDLVVSNADAIETYLNFIEDSQISSYKQQKVKNLQPSSSAFVLLLGINKQYQALTHHNIFFPDDYQREFEQIFDEKMMPEDPTIYVANTSFTNPSHAPDGGSNLVVRVNAPHISSEFDWTKQEIPYRKTVIKALEERGLTDLRNHIVCEKCITPQDFYQKFRSNKGSIYGTSSNSRLSAFRRPRNKCRSLKGLYLVGGSTHPGGGMPLVTLSAFHAVDLISRFEE